MKAGNALSTGAIYFDADTASDVVKTTTYKTKTLKFFNTKTKNVFVKTFFGRGRNKDRFEFFDCRLFFAAHSVFNILGYWLRWLFKCSRLPTPGALVKYINISAQGLGSDPWAGQIRHSVANSSLPSFREFLGVEAVLHGRS